MFIQRLSNVYAQPALQCTVPVTALSKIPLWAPWNSWSSQEQAVMEEKEGSAEGGALI